jgi:hypothetical protein
MQMYHVVCIFIFTVPLLVIRIELNEKTFALCYLLLAQFTAQAAVSSEIMAPIYRTTWPHIPTILLSVLVALRLNNFLIRRHVAAQHNYMRYTCYG